MIPIKTIRPKPEHIAARNKLLALMRTELASLDAQEMLALVAHLVGQLIALQDHRKMTPDMAMQIVSANIEAGNAEALREVQSVGGRPS